MKPQADVLRCLYQDELKSLREIGLLYGVHRNQVRRWLMQEAIPTRSVSEGTKLGMRDWKPSEEHKAKLSENAAKARASWTPDHGKKISEANLGREPANKGRKWTEKDYEIHAYRQTTEYRAMLSAAQPSGPDSPLWKGGYEVRTPRGWEWKLRRKECYARDNWTCQDCGVKCGDAKSADKGSRIQAHHIVSRSEGGGDELGNLVTLCASCHGKISRKYQGE